MDKISRYRGCLLGLAVGDALGTTLEFKPPGSFKPITDIIGGGPFNLKPGQWTDDTSMALCLAESLITCKGFDPKDQMERYCRWWKEGHLSSAGTCFDIGNTTRTALAAFLKTGNPFSGPTSPHAAGNGALMRLAPVSLFFADNPEEAIEKSGESSRTTHGATTSINACRYFGALICGVVHGEDKDTLLTDHYGPVPGYWQEHPLTQEIAEIAAGSFKRKNPPAIRGTGFVVQSLEAALWAFHHSNTFEEGCLMAVNLGDDADTTGAIYGQIAGVFYGEAGIPRKWLTKITQYNLIVSLADHLYATDVQN
ncbi:MAG: ADP-ribosylglycohydrolase family protein [Deltaproteobacteria bacterium]|nr:ADP-ribosylglycohydrolase family protein [Deltaproteobacteria bacterium]